MTKAVSDLSLVKGADILCRLLQDCNKCRFYFLQGCIDLCLADLQRLKICLVKLLRIGEQGRVSLLPDLCKDVRHNIGNIGSLRSLLQKFHCSALRRISSS